MGGNQAFGFGRVTLMMPSGHPSSKETAAVGCREDGHIWRSGAERAPSRTDVVNKGGTGGSS